MKRSWIIVLAALAAPVMPVGCAYDAAVASFDAGDGDPGDASSGDLGDPGGVSVDDPDGESGDAESLPDLEEEGCEGTLFVDGDGDGVGGESVPCDSPTDLALVEEGGDCDDGDPQKWRTVTLHPDLDMDTFTGEPRQACVGDPSPEEGVVASLPPVVSVGPSRVSILRGDEDDGWRDLDDLLRLDGKRARCRGDGDERCAVLRLEGFALDIPGGANILGVEVSITGQSRRSMEPLEVVKLLVDGQVVSEARRLEQPWPRDYEARIYGGADDRWGGDLGPGLLNSDGFGVQLSFSDIVNERELDVDIDHITVRVYHDMAFDCDDGDAQAWSLLSGFLDEDGDGRGVPVRAVTCLGEYTASPDAVSASDDDCFDANDDVFPGSSRSSSGERGDGSFDYDCDGVETPQSITTHTSCALDPLTLSCDFTSAPLQSLAPCGEVNEVRQCTLVNASCELQTLQRATSCR